MDARLGFLQPSRTRSESTRGYRGLALRRFSAVLVAAVLAIGLLPSTALAATATTTTLQVASHSVEIPIGAQSATLSVSAHVSPAPQPFQGFLPAVEFRVDGNVSGVGSLDANGDASDEPPPVGWHAFDRR